MTIDPKIRKVPTLSLKDYTEADHKNQDAFRENLVYGLKEYGFIILTDHNVNTSLLDKAYDLSAQFFSLPDETKNSYISVKGKGQRGYTPFGTEHAKDAEVQDLKEFWHVGRELSPGHRFANYYPENIWPEKDVEGFTQCFSELYTQLDQTGRILLEALTKSLEVPSDYFAKMVDDGNSILRLLHYPPLADDVDPRCVRAAAHEDINLITILVAATQSGLQLKDRDGTWLDVETEKNNLIVDAGDMLSRICNEVIPATTHRVINPQDGENNHRYSMPFFMHPHPEAILECIPSCRGEGEKYPAITADAFLQERLREIGLA